MNHYIIPCKLKSVGFPYKNRKLIKRVINSIPRQHHNKIILTTDDLELIKRYRDKLKIHYYRPRPSMKHVLLKLIEDLNIPREDHLITLYTTFSRRSREDVHFLPLLFQKIPNKSLLCRTETLTHPHNCIWEDGTQVVENDLCHRQTFPSCFQISHYFSIIQVGEVDKLGKNLYNKQTHWHNVSRSKHVDIDRKEDLEKWLS